MNMVVTQTSESVAETPERFSVSAPISLQERRYRSVKCGDTFAVFDFGGDILSSLGGSDGLYHRDTRHLSRLEITMGGLRPLLLSSGLAPDNVMLTSDLSNASGVGEPEHGALEQSVIHVQRSTFLSESSCHGRLLIQNVSFMAKTVRIELHFEADFADLFEVRGMHRERRGKILPAVLDSSGATLAYRGLDGIVRATRVSFEPKPQMLTASSAAFDVHLEPRDRTTIVFKAACTPETAADASRELFLASYVQTKRSLRASAARAAKISSEHKEFEEIMRRSTSDLRMLITQKSTGPYPYAGIPWFSTAFGRDALITGLLMLALDPAIASGVLRYLAQEQATVFDPSCEAEPGKILHEMRAGEMAVLREVPFGRYYGSVDSTPLFVMLAGAYLDRTGDVETIRALWPHIDLALGWLDRRADADGFVSYERSTEDGLANQGWKDSFDAISHADGTLARGAIALCEVQGYVYAARRAGASIARRLGFDALATELEAKAEHLRQMFEARFWCERLGTYALALDGDGRQCQVRSSNAGQLLMTGIASPERARRVAEGLMHSRLFTGWGIRTLAADEARYNPMSYHNGSVWPHDNALIALGMARMGFRTQAIRLFEAFRSACSTAEQRRLPELFCGFPRRPGQGPTSYPVACAPQAWAAATLPALVQACLGLSFDPEARSVRFECPDLPQVLNSITLRNLSLDGARVSVQIIRDLGAIAASVIERQGDIRVVTTA